jgi:hypothetical protein
MVAPRNTLIFAPMLVEPPNAANPNGNDATAAFVPDTADNGGQATKLRFNNHAPDRPAFDHILHTLNTEPSQLDTVAYVDRRIKDVIGSATIGSGCRDEFARAADSKRLRAEDRALRMLVRGAGRHCISDHGRIERPARRRVRSFWGGMLYWCGCRSESVVFC